MVVDDPRYPEWLTGQYLWCIKVAREAAQQLGWAIAIHGSLARDLDMLAVPWTDEASPECELVAAIGIAVNGLTTGVPTQKPHGRHAYTIMIGRGAHIDLSVFSGICT